MATEINNNVNLSRFGPAKTGAQEARSERREARQEEDSVAISADARTIERVSVAIQQTPAFDTEKVERITQAIRDGQYPVNAQRIAEKFLELEGQL